MNDDSPIPPSPVPDFEEPEEHTLSGTEELPRPLRRWARGQARRTRTLEKHFERGGMVAELHSDWSALKKSVGVFRWLAPIIGSFVVAVVVGIVWLVNHAVTQPPPPSAEQIVRELARVQQAPVPPSVMAAPKEKAKP